jgi:hypothetical protein
MGTVASLGSDDKMGVTISLARHQFDPAIIRHAVWLYVRFTLLATSNMCSPPADQGLFSALR